MAFPQPFLDALTERNPIDEVVGQYVSLTRRGSNLVVATQSRQISFGKKYCFAYFR